MRTIPQAVRRRDQRPVFAFYSVLGAALMVLIMHPLLEALHLWRIGETVGESWNDLPFGAVRNAFSSDMIGMTLGLAVVGALIGAVFGALHSRTSRKAEKPIAAAWTEADLRSLIEQGEGERLEFKSSLRWDRKSGKVNKALEEVVAKSIAGLMNHKGGVLLIGVDDDGAPAGIEADMSTLSHRNRDGFERCLVNLVKGRLGGQHCPHVRLRGVTLEGKTVAVIEVDERAEAIYCRDGNVDRYYVRAGNTTRELDAKEAFAHISEKAGVTG